MNKSGIYFITNKVNNKVYVGRAINLTRRKNKHFSELRCGVHDNEHLQRAFNKYGEANFTFEVAEEVAKDRLFEVESQYLALARELPLLYYNMSYSSEGGRLGLKHSEESKRRMSKALTGKKRTEEAKRRISESKLGSKHSTEAKQKISKATTGENNPFYGKHHTVEIKRKLLEYRLSKTNRVFKNKVTGETFLGIRNDFVKKYALNGAHVSSLIKGRRKFHKNWYLDN